MDLQYSGSGVMMMGNEELEESRKTLLGEIDDNGLITTQTIAHLVYTSHANRGVKKKTIVKKAQKLYRLLSEAAGKRKEAMNADLIRSLTRHQIREAQFWMYPLDPSNTYEFEYYEISGEEILRLLDGKSKESNGGRIEKERFIKGYESLGGSRMFGERLWASLAGEEVKTHFL